MHLAGCSKASEVDLYIRKEAKEMWKWLDEQQGVVYVHGPPGTGKSSIAWAWICHKSTTKTILWISLKIKMGFATVATFKDGNITSWSQMTTSVPILIGQYQGEILVIDGLTATSHQNIAGASFTWLQNKLRSKELVFVASHGNIFKTKERWKFHSGTQILKLVVENRCHHKTQIGYSSEQLRLPDNYTADQRELV